MADSLFVQIKQVLDMLCDAGQASAPKIGWDVAQPWESPVKGRGLLHRLNCPGVLDKKFDVEQADAPAMNNNAQLQRAVAGMLRRTRGEHSEGLCMQLVELLGEGDMETIGMVLDAWEFSEIRRIQRQFGRLPGVVRMDGQDISVNKAVPHTLFPHARERSDGIAHAEIAGLFSRTEKPGNSEVEETVDGKMVEIFERLESSQIVLVQGNTGSGKTTKIPRYLLEKYGRVVCSQPRKIAAISVARKVAADMGVRLGAEVGYAVRFDDVSGSKTRLKYVTDGILLREVNFDRHLRKYDVIIIDEAHERTINIDILLGYLKRILAERRDLRVVIMSATLCADRFISFFNCQMVEIRHKVFPLEIFFLKESPDDFLLEAVRTAVQIHRTEEPGDILVFLTGKEEINSARNALANEISDGDVEICMIYSSLPPEQQELVFRPCAKRKIILATNIAETSITIENVKYVVDCGRVKQMRYSSLLGMNILETVLVSKAQAKQRAGRAGRTQAGRVFRMYSRKEFGEMGENTVPEILNSNLANTILLLKSIGVDDIVNFDLIDRPEMPSVKKALELLYYLKAVESSGRITPLGLRISRLPVEPELAVSLIASHELGCLDDVSTIAAMLSVENVWLDIPKQSDAYAAASRARESYFDKRGDYFSLLHIYQEWARAGFGIAHLKKRFLNVRLMQQATKIKKQLCLGFAQPHRSNESRVVLAFCTGYFMNIAKLSENGYVSIFYDSPCYIHQSSCLFRKNAKYVLYHSLCRTGREYIKLCLEVSQEDIVRGANHML